MTPPEHASKAAPPDRIAVILNVAAGTGHSPEARERLRELFASHGMRAEILSAGNGEEIGQRVAEAMASGVAAIAAGGGDGTVSAVAARLSGTGIALAVLPLGTLNHFARDLGIPADCERAVEAIASGRRVAVDIGEVNGRPCINNASLGLYPDIVRDRTRQQRRLGRGKFWAMLWATLAVLHRSPFLRLRLEADGQPRQCRSPFVFIGNNEYTMEGFSIGTRSSLRDGRLSVYTTQRCGRAALLRLALRALFGRLHQAEDFASALVRRLRIDSRHERLLVATDGEVTSMRPPLEFTVRPGALHVIVPRP